MCVIDLQKWRNKSQTLRHPAGISLPFRGAEHTALLVPRVRESIVTGKYCCEVIRRLPGIIRERERVVVLGAGFGIVSSLTAKRRGVERVFAIEPNGALADYVNEVHRLNGVAWVEVLNALPVCGDSHRLPFFAPYDARSGSANPEGGPRGTGMLTPGVDLDLILAEEHIRLIVAGSTGNIAPLLACTDFGTVETILVGSEHDQSLDGTGSMAAHLASHGFAMQRHGGAITFSRAADRREPDAATS